MTTSSGKASDGAATQQQRKAPAPATAWSRGSTNPLTQKVSGVVTANGISSSSSAAGVKPATTSKEIKTSDTSQTNDRLLFLLANFKGLPATLTLKNGDLVSGIFSGIVGEKYSLKMCKKVPAQESHANGTTAAENVGSGSDRTELFAAHDVVDLAVENVRFDKLQPRVQNGTPSSFRTDTDISAGFRGRERELQRWDAPSDVTGADTSLENGSAGTWDQFARHKEMTGLESTYDEHNYTTRIDRSRPGFQDRARNADRIAREIEGSSTTSAHVLEERGMKSVDDSGLDEETKYSGVRRDYQALSSGQPNKYTPPAMRPPTGQPTVSGAPVDPAIISSAFADPAKQKNPQATPSGKAGEDPTPTTDGTTAAEGQETDSTTAAVADPSEKSVSQQVAPTKSTPSASMATGRGVVKEGGAAATIEKDTLDAFKQFHANEKMRVQEVQRSMARRDKAVKLNDLKKFAQNFKLHTEVPADLLPILARDEKKQTEIKDKAKKHAEEVIKKTPPRSTVTTAAPTPTDAKPNQKPSASRNEVGPTSPTVERQTQRKPSAQSGQAGPKNTPPHNQQVQGLPQRPPPGQLGTRLANAISGPQYQSNRINMQHMSGPNQQDPRLQQSAGRSGVTSPTGSTRWNPKASFTPNVTAPAFKPGSDMNVNNRTSPVRAPAGRMNESKPPSQGSLFEGRSEGRRGVIPDGERVTLHENYNPIVTMQAETKASENSNKFKQNGDIPHAFSTYPNWESLTPQENKEKSYREMFTVPAAKPSASPHYTGTNQPNLQFQHQIPHSAGQGPPQGLTPNQTPRYMVAQPHGQAAPHHYDDPHRMQFSHSASGVQPSPRPSPGYVYASQAPPSQPYGQMMYSASPNAGGYPMMMGRQPSNNPGFHPQAGQMIHQGPPGTYMAGPGMPVPMPYPGPGQQFFQHGNHMGQQPRTNGHPSPFAGSVMMVPSASASGHNAPQGMGGYFPQGGPMPGMRYPGPQFAGNPQHFNNHPQMRGTPSGSYAQPLMHNGSQAMTPPGSVPQEASVPGNVGDENK